MTETFVEVGNEHLLKLIDYKLAVSFCRKKKQKRGGVAIFTKKYIKSKELQFLKEYSLGEHFECCGIDLPLYNMFVIGLYRTPNSDFSLFISKLSALLYRVNNKYGKKKIVIVGDLNVNILQPGRKTKELRELIANYNLFFFILKNQHVNNHVLIT